MQKERSGECITELRLHQPHASKKHLFYCSCIRWLGLDLRSEKLRTNFALRRNVARCPEELLPSGQLGDIVGIDGYEVGGVNTKMCCITRSGFNCTSFSRVPLQGEATMAQELVDYGRAKPEPPSDVLIV